jgi:hypothetical protein
MFGGKKFSPCSMPTCLAVHSRQNYDKPLGWPLPSWRCSLKRECPPTSNFPWGRNRLWEHEIPAHKSKRSGVVYEAGEFTDELAEAVRIAQYERQLNAEARCPS